MDQLEALLAEDPNDPFLRYGLALEHASAGDDETAARQLLDLIALRQADPYVPAYLMAGQILQRLGRDAQAAAVLRDGVTAAHAAGNLHAMGEMEGLLAMLE